MYLNYCRGPQDPYIGISSTLLTGLAREFLAMLAGIGPMGLAQAEEALRVAIGGSEVAAAPRTPLKKSPQSFHTKGESGAIGKF